MNIHKFLRKDIVSVAWSKLEFLLAAKWINVPYTIYLNFRSFPVKQAWKLPVFVYGFPKILSLFGSMYVDGITRTGMIKINNTNPGPSNGNVNADIYNAGKIIFKGKGRIGRGVRLLVQKNALLYLGKDFKIMEMCNISVFSIVDIGSCTRIAHGSQVLDSNFHYLFDIKSNTVRRYTTPIKLGNYNWIGNRTTIMRGTKTPDYTIVASNSLLNTSYLHIPEESIIGGVPAKILSSGFRRIENKEIYDMLDSFFKEHPDEDIYYFNDDIDKEEMYRIK